MNTNTPKVSQADLDDLVSARLVVLHVTGTGLTSRGTYQSDRQLGLIPLGKKIAGGLYYTRDEVQSIIDYFRGRRSGLNFRKISELRNLLMARMAELPASVVAELDKLGIR